MRFTASSVVYFDRFPETITLPKVLLSDFLKKLNVRKLHLLGSGAGAAGVAKKAELIASFPPVCPCNFR